MTPRFWREIKYRYNLEGGKCQSCSYVMFPTRKICPKCSSAKIKIHKLGGTGKIVSFTIVRVPPVGFEKEAPYIVAIIQLDEGPRLTAQIVDCDHSEIKIGQKVKSTFRKISEDGKAGTIYYGYKFKLVK